MAQLKLGSAGVTAQESDLTGPVEQSPVGVPAGVIGTANRGLAFVPVTVGSRDEFYSKLGKTDGEKYGPLAAVEWLRNATSLTYLRILGVGDGKRREQDGTLIGRVNSAGFVVGENQPDTTGQLSANAYANSGGPPGRSYFLGCFMSESAGSTYLSDAGVQTLNTSVPIVRAMLMAASGVILRLSASLGSGVNSPPPSGLVATDTISSGSSTGGVYLSASKQEFVMLLNGHKGTDARYPNVVTASFDVTAPNYFANVFNTDAYAMQEAGHLLYARWDVHSAQAAPTGSGLVAAGYVIGAATNPSPGKEQIAFLLTSSLARNSGSITVPNYENFETRFDYATSPWIISQRFGGIAKNLFRFHALDAGQNVSNTYKICVENITPSTTGTDLYGSFDVIVREWNDLDAQTRPLEKWRGMNLDPESDRYISRVIGDLNIYFDFDKNESAQRLVVEGNYKNRSAYIRVEVAEDVEDGEMNEVAVPMGFRGPSHLMTSGTAPMGPIQTTYTVNLSDTTAFKKVKQPPFPMRTTIAQGDSTKRTASSFLYWGAHFEHPTSVSTPNASTLKNKSMESWVKFFPNFMTAYQNVIAGNNAGVSDTAANGIIDSDRFCNNYFSLENVKVVTGSTTYADPAQWQNATYVRAGGITADAAAKTRALTPTDLTVQANRKYAKFTTVIQGGFDGTNIFDEDESDLNDNAIKSDLDYSTRGLSDGPNVKTWTKAVDIMKDVVNTDIHVFAMPGIRQPTVTDYAVNAVTDRFDAIYIMDIEQKDENDDTVADDSSAISVKNTVQTLRDRNLDSSFAACYFPDVVIRDPNIGSNVVVPPSVAVLGAFALNDLVGHPWFAPAGFARGALSTTLEARVKLSKENMDDLYDVNINPLVAFAGNGNAQLGPNPQGGVVVWGQKTLQAAATSLNRVNVRRLLIDIRRKVRDIVRTTIFEPNLESTLASFTARITPELVNIQKKSGLQRFKVLIDASSTTQDDIENNTIRGKIIVTPTKSIEQIGLDFAVSNNVG